MFEHFPTIKFDIFLIFPTLDFISEHFLQWISCMNNSYSGFRVWTLPTLDFMFKHFLYWISNKHFLHWISCMSTSYIGFHVWTLPTLDLMFEHFLYLIPCLTFPTRVYIEADSHLTQLWLNDSHAAIPDRCYLIAYHSIYPIPSCQSSIFRQ